MTMDNVVLSIVNLHKSYASVPALSGVSLIVKAGEYIGLLGPNGAGKSTLFQIVTGLFSADQGEVELFGKTFRDSRSQVLAQVGVVFQSRSVDMDMTIEENLRFHGKLFGLKGDTLKNRLNDLGEQFGISDLKKRKVRELSGGQQRKVEIARAMLNKPRLLIMDEPSAGLDMPSRHLLVQEMQELARRSGVAILWATHLVDEVENADRIIILCKGRIVGDGLPSAICTAAGADNITKAYSKLVNEIPKVSLQS
jgi:ABC-2 type transport system ATP-binding protein